ncbi:hypothetical protein BDR22DRAFT_889110 [Usnea florida]
MAENQSTIALPAADEESEWEYDGGQTFYVTLDISSAVEGRNPRADKQKPHPSPLEPFQPTSSIAPTTPTAQDNAGPSEPPESPGPGTPTPMDVDQDEEEPSLSGPEDRIQILDLHTLNPIVSYRNQMYSCEWTSTLGTDLILTTPTPDFPHPILREKPDVSVLAASRIKLMGRPAQIANRHGAKEDGQQTPPAPEPSTTLPNTASAENHIPFKIPLGPMTNPARQKQANFLERFMALKAKKGEKDSITIQTQKVNQGSGWRSQRKASEAREDGDDEVTPKQSRRSRATVGRPLGSRRNRGPRTAKGGLFRDYRPQLWDTPGADIRAGHSSTPESWDQLEYGASDGKQTPAVTTVNASPSPADQLTQTGNARSQSPSAPASAHVSQASHFPSLLQATNDESGSVHASGSPGPDLAASSEQPQAIVTDDGVIPASRAGDGQTLQEEQEQTGDTIAEQNIAASRAATSTLKENGMTAANDVEMRDA